MGRVEGKVMLISGGARGMGAVESRLFVREGAKVVFGDILDEDGAKVEAQIREEGGEAVYVHLDVTKESDWREAVGVAESRYGRMDILVNNAGILIRKGIEDTSEAEWDRLMEVNAKGVFLGTRSAIPALKRSGGGSIVNISSVAGLVASRYSSGSYAATKGAVRLLTKATALEYAEHGIRCNSVHPGLIESPMTRELLSDAAHLDERLRGIPMGRPGSLEEVAYGVLYLASDESSYVTGSELVIDGGRTAT